MAAHYETFPSGALRRRRRFKLIAANGEQVGPASQSSRDETDAVRAIVDHCNAALSTVTSQEIGRVTAEDIDIRRT